MRSREFIETNDWSKALMARTPANQDFYLGFYSSNSPTAWGNNPGTAYWSRSAMVDETSPEHVVPRGYHSCLHSKFSGAVVQHAKIVKFSPPTPTMRLLVNSPIVYQPSTPVPSGPWSSMADELSSLASGTTDNSSMLAVSLLEAAKTVEMMRNPFNFLKPNFQRRVGKLTAATLSQRASGIWLESYYGWKSFKQDVDQIAQASATFLNEPTTIAFEKLGEKLSVRQKVHNDLSNTRYVLGTSESTWNTQAANGWCYASNGRPKRGTYARLSDHVQNIYYTLGCRQFLEAKRRLSTTRRLLSAVGMTSWRSIRDTIWEVIPFSFVIDWFVDSKGLWAPLNKWRLSQMDIKEVGFSTRSAGSYHVEVYADPYRFEYGPGLWVGKTPTSHENPVAKSIVPGTYSVYSRNPGFPSGMEEVSLFSGKGLSFIRGMNGAALITQLLSKPRH